jgi:sensor histidine kinase YesM
MNTRKINPNLGFNDTLFMLIGMPLLALLIMYLFNSSVTCIQDFFISFFVSLIFTVCNWLVMRWFLLQLRKRFPLQKDTLKRILIVFLSIVFTINGLNFIGNSIMGSIIGETYHGPDSKTIIIITLLSIMLTAIYEAIYFFKKLQESIRQEEQAQQIVVQANLDSLRNQAQPHFLFNSLNILQDIIDNDSKENAQQFVRQFSDVYRFILDTGKNNLIGLNEEIAFTKSYLYIQQERFGDNLKVEWDINTDIESKYIIPMSLQLLVENAIKHNVISVSMPLTIHISNANSRLIVENNLQEKSTKLESTKIGLANIKKRYELMGEDMPVIESDASIFRVSLPIFENKL